MLTAATLLGAAHAALRAGREVAEPRVRLAVARAALKVAEAAAPAFAGGTARHTETDEPVAYVASVALTELEASAALMNAGRAVVRAYLPAGATLVDDLDDDEDDLL